MLKVVVDTNVLLVALSPKSSIHWIYQAFLNKAFTLVVSNEIVLEYEEQMRLRYGDDAISEFLMIMAEAENVVLIEPYFKWNLISADPDDNKFADAYISSAADYLVTHDKHFNVLKAVDFPVVNVVDTLQLKSILRS